MSMLPAIPASGAARPDSQRPPIDRGALGQQLGQELKEAQNARSLYEQRWLDDLRQYKGFYAPAVAEQLRKNKRSQVYYRLTTNKVNTMVARLMDLLFPQRSKNWSISPTPDPMLPPDIIAEDMADEINAAMQRALESVMQDLGARRIAPDMLAMQKLQANAYQQALAEIDTPETRQRVQ